MDSMLARIIDCQPHPLPLLWNVTSLCLPPPQNFSKDALDCCLKTKPGISPSHILSERFHNLSPAPSLQWQCLDKSLCPPLGGPLPKPWSFVASEQLFIDFLMVCFALFPEESYQKAKQNKTNKGEEIIQNILKIYQESPVVALSQDTLN